jgi:hypothetical protein
MPEKTNSNQTTELLLAEYIEAGEYLRHYANLQFAVLTVYLAINAGLIVFIFGTEVSLPSEALVLRFPSITLREIAKMGGLLASYIFWSIEDRSLSFNAHMHRRAVELENKLEFNLYRKGPRPRKPFLGASLAMRILYLLITAFWVYSFFI